MLNQSLYKWVWCAQNFVEKAMKFMGSTLTIKFITDNSECQDRVSLHIYYIHSLHIQTPQLWALCCFKGHKLWSRSSLCNNERPRVTKLTMPIDEMSNQHCSKPQMPLSQILPNSILSWMKFPAHSSN